MTQPGYTLWIAVTAALLAAMAPAAVADVYKCTTASGRVTYQDEPCGNARDQLKLAIEPQLASPDEIAAAREAAAALRQQDKELAERLQRDTESRRELAAATPPPVYDEPAPADESRDSDRAVIFPYQPGVWRAGVYYPPQYGNPPYGQVDDHWYPGQPHHHRPSPIPPAPHPAEPERQRPSKLGHSTDDPQP